MHDHICAPTRSRVALAHAAAGGGRSDAPPTDGGAASRAAERSGLTHDPLASPNNTDIHTSRAATIFGAATAALLPSKYSSSTALHPRVCRRGLPGEKEWERAEGRWGEGQSIADLHCRPPHVGASKSFAHPNTIDSAAHKPNLRGHRALVSSNACTLSPRLPYGLAFLCPPLRSEDTRGDTARVRCCSLWCIPSQDLALCRRI